MSPKDEAVAAIDRARADMEEALGQLEQIPMFDSGNIAYAAHALQSYLTVINGTSRLLEKKFQDSNDPEVHRWLQGLQHTTELMTHTVCQLMNTGAAGPSLKLSMVEVPVLVERACSYYRHIAARKQIPILFRAGADTPPVWVDRVALAAASIVVGAMAAGTAVWMALRPAPPSVTRLIIPATGATALVRGGGSRDLTMSPDGRRIAYRGDNQIFLRALDSLHATPVLAGGGSAASPFFSPDGQWVGFASEGQLKKVAISGGAAVPLTALDGLLRGAVAKRVPLVKPATDRARHLGASVGE